MQQRGFRWLGVVFAILLALPAAGYLAALLASRDASFAQPSDVALAGILFTGAAVVGCALASGSRAAHFGAAAFCAGAGLVALVIAPEHGRVGVQDAALGAFLLAGALSIALSAPPPAAQRSSTNATQS